MEDTKLPAAQVWDWPLQHNDGMVNIINDGNRFEADLEVPSFRQNEIDVKVINDELVLHCQQDAGSGRLPREIHRAYRLPADVDPKSIKTSLGGDGLLKLTANKKGM